MIHASNVHKRFGPVHAVRGVSFRVETGQVLGILGPNGAGKTTTVRMITGSFPPTSRAVTVDGLDTVDDSLASRRRLGYLPENAPLYPEMRVTQYLDYRARLYSIRRRERRERLEHVIERCALSEMRHRRIGTLSKGYTQRVGLAAALIHDPPVLVLDEPTSGLDPAQIAETRALIRDLAGDHTMILVSHILPEVEKTCDRILIFAGGRIRADGRPETLIRDVLGHTSVVAETRESADDGTPAPDALARLQGVRAMTARDLPDGCTAFEITFDESVPEDPRERVARCARESGLFVRELRYRAATLEDLYIRLTTEEPGDGVTT